MPSLEWTIQLLYGVRPILSEMIAMVKDEWVENGKRFLRFQPVVWNQVTGNFDGFRLRHVPTDTVLVGNLRLTTVDRHTVALEWPDTFSISIDPHYADINDETLCWRQV